MRHDDNGSDWAECAIICPVDRLSLDTVVVRSAKPLMARVGEELVILDSRDSRYYGLDPIGRRMWELLERPQSVDALCRILQDEFDVAEETCRRDVLPFLEQLSDARLLEIR